MLSDSELYSGLVRLHILHHAARRSLYGMWIIEELAHHGYRLGAGTLYPLLHRMERRGLLRSNGTRPGPRVRRIYRITPLGRKSLLAAKQKVRELFGELFEIELTRVFGTASNARRNSGRRSGGRRK